jgi:hypothetical protein
MRATSLAADAKDRAQCSMPRLTPTSMAATYFVRERRQHRSRIHVDGAVGPDLAAMGHVRPGAVGVHARHSQPCAVTGRHASLDFCQIHRFGRDGLVDVWDSYYDILSLLVQLGHAQPPPKAWSPEQADQAKDRQGRQGSQAFSP